MRLVCPNCSAQYEVDSAVIPDEGRDVLCSACGHSWFQPSERMLAESAASETSAPEPEPQVALVAESAADPFDDEALAEDDGAAQPVDPWIEPAAEAEPAVEDLMAAGDIAPAGDPGIPDQPVTGPFAADALIDGPDADVEVPGFDPAADDVATDDPAPLRRVTIDDAMLNVLREEAAREAEARRSDGTSIEMQPDLGLPEPGDSQDIAAVGAATVRALRSHDDDAEHGPGLESPAPAANRRALLPDIEVINSTLTATSERRDLPSMAGDPHASRRARGGFRTGFSLSLLAAVALLALYMIAPGLSERAPALAPALGRYVAAVDAGRIWLDEKMRNSADAMRDTATN